MNDCLIALDQKINMIRDRLGRPVKSRDARLACRVSEWFAEEFGWR